MQNPNTYLYPPSAKIRRFQLPPTKQPNEAIKISPSFWSLPTVGSFDIPEAAEAAEAAGSADQNLRSSRVSLSSCLSHKSLTNNRPYPPARPPNPLYDYPNAFPITSQHVYHISNRTKPLFQSQPRKLIESEHPIPVLLLNMKRFEYYERVPCLIKKKIFTREGIEFLQKQSLNRFIKKKALQMISNIPDPRFQSSTEQHQPANLKVQSKQESTTSRIVGRSGGRKRIRIFESLPKRYQFEVQSQLDENLGIQSNCWYTGCLDWRKRQKE